MIGGGLRRERVEAAAAAAERWQTPPPATGWAGGPGRAEVGVTLRAGDWRRRSGSIGDPVLGGRGVGGGGVRGGAGSCELRLRQSG